MSNKIRAEKLATDPPKNDKDYTWQTQMNRSYKGKPRKPGRVLPEGTFTKSPSEIAHQLKMHSGDYDEASKKLNGYINRQGRNLQGGDRKRLYDAKEHLKNAYGEQNRDKQKTEALVEQSIYSLPQGHNKDDGMVNLLKTEPDNREKHVFVEDDLMNRIPRSNALARLKASILNSTQDGGTKMSSVEANGGSTSAENLDETNITPKESMADATFDSLDNTFNETKTPTNTAYAKAYRGAALFLERAVQVMETKVKLK